MRNDLTRFDTRTIDWAYVEWKTIRHGGKGWVGGGAAIRQHPYGFFKLAPVLNERKTKLFTAQLLAQTIVLAISNEASDTGWKGKGSAGEKHLVVGIYELR